jgi:hypothetical protein
MGSKLYARKTDGKRYLLSGRFSGNIIEAFYLYPVASVVIDNVDMFFAKP